MGFDDIPLESIWRAWLASSDDVVFSTVEVIAYLHCLSRPAKSSPRQSRACLALVASINKGIPNWTLAPIYKYGRRHSWDAGERMCGDRLIPLDPGYRTFSSYPSNEQIDELVVALDFFNIPADVDVLESWYVLRDGAPAPAQPGA